MKVLIACEESQVVCKEFRKRKHEAYSCDTVPCSGGHPEWHIQDDVLNHLEGWDLIIAHPPCTFLCISGNRWFKPQYKDRFPNREQERADAFNFFMKLANAPCEKIAIENPVGVISKLWRPPDQYVHPYYFGDPASKKTGLWLKNLPLLTPTKIVTPTYYTDKNGNKHPLWHFNSLGLPKAQRSQVRSKTFKGLAKAMAKQWG